MIVFSIIATHATAGVRLPLEGYCKPGRYLPVEVDGADAAHPIQFSSDGCFESIADGPGSDHMIVPILVTGEPRALNWAGGSAQLRTVREDERLIAAATDRINPAGEIFPGKQLIPVQLDLADFLPGPPVCWETLDAILMDAPQFARLSDTQRSALLSGGVKLIATGKAAPDTRWPWKQAGHLWILSFPVAGPFDETIDQNIYAPTFAWTPGWSAAVRAQAVAVGALVVLLTIAALLLPTRFAMWIAMLVPILATAAILAWKQSLGAVNRAGGDVIVAADGLLQRDALVYERARAAATETIPWSGWTHPLFASASALSHANLRIKLSASNQLSFTYDIAPNQTMAFLHRDIQPGSLPAITPSQTSPMREAAKLEYLGTGQRIAGEVPAAGNRWSAVVIAKK